jgi:hypothetical protein
MVHAIIHFRPPTNTSSRDVRWFDPAFRNLKYSVSGTPARNLLCEFKFHGLHLSAPRSGTSRSYLTGVSYFETTQACSSEASEEWATRRVIGEFRRGRTNQLATVLLPTWRPSPHDVDFSTADTQLLIYRSVGHTTAAYPQTWRIA